MTAQPGNDDTERLAQAAATEWIIVRAKPGQHAERRVRGSFNGRHMEYEWQERGKEGWSPIERPGLIRADGLDGGNQP